MALARRYPNLTATVFELPAAAEVARDIIAQAGMSDQVTVLAGDFQQEELGQGYDVALIFGVLVSETTEGKLALLRKAHAALSPGGLVVIRESWFNPDDPAQSSEAALFSLHTLLANSVGDVMSLAELQALLARAGFAGFRQVDLPDQPGASLGVAYKPGPGLPPPHKPPINQNVFVPTPPKTPQLLFRQAIAPTLLPAAITAGGAQKWRSASPSCGRPTPAGHRAAGGPVPAPAPAQIVRPQNRCRD